MNRSLISSLVLCPKPITQPRKSKNFGNFELALSSQLDIVHLQVYCHWQNVTADRLTEEGFSLQHNPLLPWEIQQFLYKLYTQSRQVSVSTLQMYQKIITDCHATSQILICTISNQHKERFFDVPGSELIKTKIMSLFLAK